MNILMVGAGGIGGYFGARLIEKGENVTFLVRPARKKQLEQTGLNIKSIHGDITIPSPKLITAGEQTEPFDVILISTKAYHLDQAIRDITPFTHNQTIILPLLNGYRHISQLTDAFGQNRVIGGLCFIETTLDQNGTIIQTSPAHNLLFGERSGETTTRITKLNQHFTGTKTNFIHTTQINKEMWHKYTYITNFSGITALFNSAIGPVLQQPSGQQTIRELFNELTTIARAENAPIDQDTEQTLYHRTIEMMPEMKSSMLRDMEKQHQIEVDHLQGHFKQLAQKHNISTPILNTIYTKLKLYQQTL